MDHWKRSETDTETPTKSVTTCRRGTMLHKPASNPYRPPLETDAPQIRLGGRALACSVAGTIMVLAIAVTLWVLTVAFLDRMIPSDFDMLLWSISLLCSLVVAAIIIARTGRFRPRLSHLTLAAIAAIGAYAWLEGQAPKAGGSLHAIVFYVTAVLVPVVLLIATALTPNYAKTIQHDG